MDDPSIGSGSISRVSSRTGLSIQSSSSKLRRKLGSSSKDSLSRSSQHSHLVSVENPIISIMSPHQVPTSSPLLSASLSPSPSTRSRDAPTGGFRSDPPEDSSVFSRRNRSKPKKMDDEFYKVMEDKLKLEDINKEKQQESISANNNNVISFSSSTTTLEPLPWTEDDKDILREQIAFWKNCLLEDDERLPKEDVRDLLKSLYSFLRQERATRSDRLLREISQKLEDLKALDLTKLVSLMDAQRKAGDAMEDKDVILLTGAVGSGKTTTLHFLAGTQFEEIEVDGFMHLEPAFVKDSRIEDCKTSCGRDAVTKCLQAVPVSIRYDNRDELVVICDVPGIGSASTVEEELAFHYGMGSAIGRAKRIKPVVVLSEELMGSCFTNLPDALRLMKQEMSLKSPRDLKPLDYIFTHYEERHRTRLHQQFASLKTNGGLRNRNGQNSLYEELVDDIIAKTTPKAKLAMPLDDDPQALLRDLWKESFVKEPQGLYCQDLPSDSALKQLQLQLQITLEELKMALSREAYSEALNRIVILERLSTWFPQAKQAAQLAKEAASRQINTIWKWMAKEIGDSHYEQVLCRMEQISEFGSIFPDAQDCSKRGYELLWESLIAPMEEQDYVLAMERIGKLSQLSVRFGGASQCVKRALRMLRKRMDSSIETGHFKDSLSLLIPLSSLSETVPEAGECANNILAGLKESMETSITVKKDYPLALDMIRKLTALKSLYPQVGEMADCGMSLCRQMVESSVAQGDYDSALFLVQHMQRLQIEFPQAGEIAEYGLGVFITTIEVLIRHKDYSRVIPLMKKISEEVPGSWDCVRDGLSQIKEMLEQAIKEQDFQSALEIIYEVNSLAKTLPEADACIEYGFKSLEANILTCIENQEYETVIQLIELLSEGENRLPLAKECTRVGIEVLKKNVSRAIEKRNYSPALEMIQQFSNTKGYKMSEVGECSRRGLEMLSKAAQKAISDRDYPTAIEIITNLSELTKTLPESKACAVSSIQSIVDHVAELRQNVEKTVEEVAATRDLKVFVAMLLKLKSQIEKVTKSEPLRKLAVQLHYKKNFRTTTKEEGENTVLFVPQLYTSQAFCSDHIEILAGHVREKLPDFDIADACMDTLIRNRKAMLSVMIRLKATHKILQHCPGGEKATAVYFQTFEQFHALLETVLAVAEESFKPPLDMRVFELQAWFLSVLIKGFIKDKIDVDSDERKQMEELESRRRVLMLQFEVKMTEALEFLSDQDFVVSDNGDEEPKESVDPEKAEDSSIVATKEDEADQIVITKEAIDNLDFSVFEQQRTMLLSLCQRPELFRMVLKHHNSTEVETIVKTFDKSLVVYIAHMVKYGDAQYNALLDFARSGASIPATLDQANDLRAQVDKIEAQILIARNWSQEFASVALLDQQRLLILKKRIELATEKLEDTIKAGNEIGFRAFLSTMAKPFVCNGRWYDDIPESIL